MSSHRYTPILDSIGVPLVQGKLPVWFCAKVKKSDAPSARTFIAVGVLAPGVLTKDQALDLAMRLVELAHTIQE